MFEKRAIQPKVQEIPGGKANGTRVRGNKVIWKIWLPRKVVLFSGKSGTYCMFPIHSSLEIPENSNRNFSSKCRKPPIFSSVTGHSMLFRKKVRGLRDDWMIFCFIAK